MSRVFVVPDLQSERWHSMDRYAGMLISELRQVDEEGVEIEVADWETERSGNEASSSLRAPPSPLRTLFRRYVGYPLRIRRRRADVIHVLDQSYAHLLHASPIRPAVVTVHDLLPTLVLRQRAPYMWQRLRNLVIRWTLAGLRKADAFIVPSRWLAERVREWSEDERPVHVVPYGVGEEFFDETGAGRDEDRDTLGLPGEPVVVLHVGSTVERKNVPLVIATVTALRRQGRDAWLVHVGAQLTPVHRRLIEEAGLTDRVRAIEDASEPLLRRAYRAADVLLFPSLYEGFGLPVLEAFASGLPVVTSGAGGLSELAANAGLIVDTREVEPFVDAVTRVLDDAALRADLVARGRTRARAFTWRRTAALTLAVYRGLR